MPGAGARPAGCCRRPDRVAVGRQFPRSGAARRLQPSDHAGVLRPHRALRQDGAARPYRAQVPVLGPAGQRADRRVRPRAAQGRHALSLRAAMRAHQDHRRSAEDGQGASADRGANGDGVRFVRAERRRGARHRSRTPPAKPRPSTAAIWSAPKARAASRGRTSTSSSRASPIRNARSTSRSPTTSASTATPNATTFPIRTNTPTCSTGRARRTAGASTSRPTSTTTRTS